MNDLNKELQHSFERLQKEIPELIIPRVYAQIGALDESIVVGDSMIGISLDKYMGVNYPLYKKHYTLQQRESMTRQNIIPDCLSFYLLSLYPLDNFDLSVLPFVIELDRKGIVQHRYVQLLK